MSKQTIKVTSAEGVTTLTLDRPERQNAINVLMVRELEQACYSCEDYQDCPQGKAHCPLPDILDFHRRVIPCGKALSLAMQRMEGLDIAALAPQHGGILRRQRDVQHLIGLLKSLDRVGIDRHLPG